MGTTPSFNKCDNCYIINIGSRQRLVSVATILQKGGDAMRKQIGFILIVAAVVAVREMVRYQRELLAQPGAQFPSWDRPLTNGYDSFVPYSDGGSD